MASRGTGQLSRPKSLYSMLSHGVLPVVKPPESSHLPGVEEVAVQSRNSVSAEKSWVFRYSAFSSKFSNRQTQRDFHFFVCGANERSDLQILVGLSVYFSFYAIGGVVVTASRDYTVAIVVATLRLAISACDG